MTELNHYLNQPKTYKILDLEVHVKPLKLRWNIISYPINDRLNRFVKESGGFTDEEMGAPKYTVLIRAYESSFFSQSYNPNPELEELKLIQIAEITGDSTLNDVEKKRRLDAVEILTRRQSTGKENLTELLSIMVQEEIDWKKFIEEHVDNYNEIKEAGIELYYDFFSELFRLRTM